MKRPASQNKRVGEFGMSFRARNVFWTFKERSPGRFRVVNEYRFFLKTGLWNALHQN